VEVLKLVMRIQLIQQKVPIGSQIILTLRNDEKVSGLLTEIGLDYITLDLANRQKIILADAILMFDVQGQDNEVEASNPTDTIPDQVEVSNPTDASTESADTVLEQVETPDSTDAGIDSTALVESEEQASEQLDEIEKRFKNEIERVEELQRLLETALEPYKQVTFEEQERLCVQLRNHCQDRLREIEESPTNYLWKMFILLLKSFRKK
jgi:hypothetical protein